MGNKVLVVGGDLMARQRIVSSVQAVGADADFASFGGLAAALEEDSFDVVIVDLDDGRDGVLDEVGDARRRELLPDVVLGYYSHIDAALGERAAAAGVQPLRRGQFWSSLPSLLE